MITSTSITLLEDIIEAIIKNKIEWPRTVYAPMSLVLRAYQTGKIKLNDIEIIWRYEPNITIYWKLINNKITIETTNQF